MTYNSKGSFSCMVSDFCYMNFTIRGGIVKIERFYLNYILIFIYQFTSILIILGRQLIIWFLMIFQMSLQLFYPSLSSLSPNWSHCIFLTTYIRSLVPCYYYLYCSSVPSHLTSIMAPFYYCFTILISAITPGNVLGLKIWG